MAPHHTLLLILTGLTGVHSITTISNVPATVGGSITIPCLYQLEYTWNAKYLCGGESWRGCSYLVQTSSSNQTVSGRFSISDDKSQRIFHVTIKNLSETDTYFWCNVEIKNGGDDGKSFRLSVTSGLHVDTQEIRGVIGGTINISCHHSQLGDIMWCKLGRSCVASHEGAIDGTNVTIKNLYNVSSVSMIGLTNKSSGWYYCQKGDLQMPVHVTVTQKHNTSTDTSTETQHSPLMGLIISLLIVIVLVALFICFMVKNRQEKRSETSAIPKVEAEVTYCSVTYKRKTQPQAEAPDIDVTYSMLAVS